MCLFPVLGPLSSPAGSGHPHAEGLRTKVPWLLLTLAWALDETPVAG